MKERTNGEDGGRKALAVMVAALFAVTAFAVVFAAADTDNENGFDSVLGAGEITAISAGNNHTLALKSDGTVWSWGANGYGKLGLGAGAGTFKATPQQGTGLTGVTAIAGAYDSSFAIKSDGTLWAWGYNGMGQLGDGTRDDRNTPVKVTGLTGVAAVASGHSFTIALKNDGTVWTWGSNTDGQLGNGESGSGLQSSTPLQVAGLSGIKAIAAGYDCAFVIKADNTLWAWGDNTYGQLGTNEHGSTTSKTAPVQVLGVGGSGNLTNVKTVTAGIYHTTAVKNDGTVWSWGYSLNGQLGDGTDTRHNTPVQTLLTDVTAASSRMYHTIALKSDGTVYGWGSGGSGRLGNGDTTNRTAPVQTLGKDGVGFLTGVTAISAGEAHSVALKNDGTVWTWGWNKGGQLGIGTSGDGTHSTTPVQVTFSATSGGGGGGGDGGGGISVVLIVAVVAIIAVAGAAAYFFFLRK